MIITDKAKTRFKEIYETDNKLPRLYVLGGGCSGFSYVFDVSDKEDDDLLIEDVLLVDTTSFSILENATVDWVNDLTGRYFKVDIPEAKSFCGCGTSFSL